MNARTYAWAVVVVGASSLVAARARAAEPRFALGVGGASVPGTTVYGAQVAYVLAAPDWTKDVRIGLLGWASEDKYTKGKGGVLTLEQNHWWSTYGLGYGSGIGQASFEPKRSAGWDGSSVQILAYFTPVALRFGRGPAFETSVDIGVTRFFSPPTKRDDSGVRPFGMVTLGAAF
ncbi:MAG: hypothetical protein IT374_15060 [Polyangiaceae bacterium]|nr:hypothetical protein [Polyangiaceae bacterium]